MCGSDRNQLLGLRRKRAFAEDPFTECLEGILNVGCELSTCRIELRGRVRIDVRWHEYLSSTEPSRGPVACSADFRSSQLNGSPLLKFNAPGIAIPLAL